MQPAEAFADLRHRLGDIPVDRIVAQPAPGTAVYEDWQRASREGDRLYELIDGTLVEKPMGLYEGYVTMLLATYINQFVLKHGLGAVFGPDSPISFGPNQVREPDISFIAKQRLPADLSQLATAPMITVDLAIEVLSPSNTRREMQRKRQLYFGSGSQLVWEIEPRQQAAFIYESVDDVTVLGNGDSLDGAGVLPGFVLPLSALFGKVAGRADGNPSGVPRV